MEFIWDRMMTMAVPTNTPTCQRVEQIFGAYDTIILTAGVRHCSITSHKYSNTIILSTISRS